MPRSGGKRGEQKHVQASRGQESLAVQPPAVQVFVLGGFKVVVRSQVLPEHAWRRKTARQLFKILLSRPNRRMTRDEVIELLWPESDPEAASSNLRSTLFALRHALEPSTEPATMAVIFSDRDGVWLRPDVELWVDADAFEHTVDQAWRSADPLPLLERAGSLYAGHYLPEDLYEDWATDAQPRSSCGCSPGTSDAPMRCAFTNAWFKRSPKSLTSNRQTKRPRFIVRSPRASLASRPSGRRSAAHIRFPPRTN